MMITLMCLCIFPFVSADENDFELNISQDDTDFRNQVTMGFLHSGADAEDIDEGIFGWDYVSYFSYRYRINEKNRVRFKHQYWSYLDKNYKNVFDLKWQHQIKPFHILSVSTGYIQDKEKFREGNVYLGYQGLAGKDFQWVSKVGFGYDSEHDANMSLVFEGLKPLSNSTLLRFSDTIYASTSHYRSNEFKVNLIQALHKRLALNMGYRFFINNQADNDTDDLSSHEASAALTWQMLENVYLTGKYRHYWNSADTEADTFSLISKWDINNRLCLTGGYQYQDYDSAPDSNSFMLGMTFDF